MFRLGSRTGSMPRQTFEIPGSRDRGFGFRVEGVGFRVRVWGVGLGLGV